MLFGFVVEALQNHSERAFPEPLLDLVAVVDVVGGFVEVVPLVVIEAEVQVLGLIFLIDRLRALLHVPRLPLRVEAHEVNVLELLDLFLLVGRELLPEDPGRLGAAHGELGVALGLPREPLLEGAHGTLLPLVDLGARPPPRRLLELACISEHELHGFVQLLVVEAFLGRFIGDPFVASAAIQAQVRGDHLCDVLDRRELLHLDVYVDIILLRRQ
mmetsp:Transcript_31941/g.31201  ORF Transcript_31941/g.31201 Transcript_31941/m.31201 type:complete len:215 (-) Transcript_31941:1116-1760(-)